MKQRSSHAFFSDSSRSIPLFVYSSRIDFGAVSTRILHNPSNCGFYDRAFIDPHLYKMNINFKRKYLEEHKFWRTPPQNKLVQESHDFPYPIHRHRWRIHQNTQTHSRRKFRVLRLDTYQIWNTYIEPFSRYCDHKKLICDDQTDEPTYSTSPNFLCDHFNIKVIHTPNSKSLELTTLKISR